MSAFKPARISQPQGPVEIDWANPLCRTITNCIPFGAVNRDIVTGNQVTLLSSAPIIADVRGLSLRGSGSAAVGSIPLNLSKFRTLTISFWMYWDAYANDDAFAFEHTSNTNTNDGGFTVTPNDSGYSLFAVYNRRTNGSTGSLGTIVRPSAGAWHHYAFLIDRTVNTSGGLATRAYVDGAAVSVTNRFTANSTTTAFANSTLYLFSRNNASLFGAGRLQNLIFRGGYLMPANEVLQEYLNPWQIFTDTQRPIFVGLGAAPAGDTYTLTADSVSVALSGQAATLSANRVIPADTASIAFSGQAATLTRGYTIAADTASIAVAGQAASLLSNKVLPLTTASIAFAGQDAALTYSPITGATYTLPATASSIAISAQDAALVQNRRLTAETLAFDLALQAATLTHGYVMQAASGDYALAGQDAALVATRRLAADSEALALTGQAVNFAWSGEEFSASVYQAISPAMSYTAVSPAMNYTVSVNPQTYSA